MPPTGSTDPRGRQDVCAPAAPWGCPVLLVTVECTDQRQRGFRATPRSVEDLRQIAERGGLEVEAVRLLHDRHGFASQLLGLCVLAAVR